MYENKNPMLQDRIENVTKKSWTFERLTPQEKQQCLLLLSNIKSTAKTRHGAFMAIEPVYKEFLDTVGYTHVGWREPDPENVPVF